MQTQCKAELAMSYTAELGILLWKDDLDVFFFVFFCKNSIAHSTGPVYIPV